MDFTAVFVATAVFGVSVILVFALSIKIIQPYQQGVVTLFGSFRRVLNPGLNFVTPQARVLLVDLRSRPESVGPFRAPLPDGSSMEALARAEVRVVDVRKATFLAQDSATAIRTALQDAVSRAARTTPTLPAGGDGARIAETARSELRMMAEPLGYAVGRLELTLTTPLGRVDYVSGDPLPVTGVPRQTPA